MSQYQIITDACADLPVKLVEELGVHVIPMSFNFGEESYTHYPDEREYTAKDFFDRLRNGDMSTTNQINQAEFTDVFESYLQNGVDVLYIGFSSALSGTYHNSVMVAEELCKKYPEQTLLVADSLTATLGTGLLVYAAVQKQREGMTIQELYQCVQNERLLVSGWFTVDDLHFLKRGGRLSGTAALVGTMLGIKPILRITEDGKLVPMEKVRGRKQSLHILLEHMEKTFRDTGDQVVFIVHGDCPDDAAYLKKEIKSRYHIKRIVTNNIGPIIGSHTGPGAIAIFYIGKGRN